MRIVLKGTSGSGKTTLGKLVAARLGAPYIELDSLVHLAGWQEASDDTLRANLTAALAGQDRWVVDGNYDHKLGDFLLDQADLIVWLDLPLALKLRRLWQRTWRVARSGEPLWNGNRQTWRLALLGTDSLFVWAIRAHFRHRRQWPSRLATKPHLRLRAVSEVDRWLATL